MPTFPAGSTPTARLVARNPTGEQHVYVLGIASAAFVELAVIIPYPGFTYEPGETRSYSTGVLMKDTPGTYDVFLMVGIDGQPLEMWPDETIILE